LRVWWFQSSGRRNAAHMLATNVLQEIAAAVLCMFYLCSMLYCYISTIWQECVTQQAFGLSAITKRWYERRIGLIVLAAVASLPPQSYGVQLI